MTPEQKYLFDLQGFIVLEDVVPRSVLEACNQSLDEFEEMDPGDYPPPLCLGTEKTEEELYISNILEASPVFSPLIDIPEVLDVVAEVTGGPWRLNHTYTIYRWGGGYTGPAHARHADHPQVPVSLPQRADGLDPDQGGLPPARLRRRGRLLRRGPWGPQEQLPASLGTSSRRDPGPRAGSCQGRGRHRLHRGPDPRLDGQRLGAVRAAPSTTATASDTCRTGEARALHFSDRVVKGLTEAQREIIELK